jgi:hypothetical protein
MADKSISVTYMMVRSRQLEGTYFQGPGIGISIVTSCRIMKGWGIPDETDWPSNRLWPPPQPLGIDAKAKRSRVRAYQRARSSIDCKIAIAAGHTVTAGLDITDQWFSAKNGVIEMPSPEAKQIGGHSVFLHGYDDDKSLFYFQNSWGVEWGNEGRGSFPYEFFDNFCGEAWIARELYDGKRMNSNETTIMELSWGIEDILGGVLRGIEIYDAGQDECIGWAFAVCRGGYLDVEELFVKPKFQGQKNGYCLARGLKELAAKLDLPLRLWIPQVNSDSVSISKMQKIIKYLSLRLFPSDVRWARFKAIS